MTDPTDIETVRRFDVDRGLDHERVLEVFHRIGSLVGDRLARTTDWGPSGRRPGQYAVDLDVDRIVLDELAGTGWAVLSEESGRTGPVDAPVVVVDPLDGSTNAARGVPWFATAMCLVHDGVPRVATVVVHPTGSTYDAVRGRGAWCDGRRLRVTACRDLGRAVVGVSGLPTHHYGWSQFRALGAAAPDLCAVADGVLDAWCDMSDDAHGVWDYLAALLVCEEAGASVADAFGRELVVLDHSARRTPVVAASPELLAAVLAQRTGAGGTVVPGSGGLPAG